MFSKIKNHLNIYPISLFIFLTACQLQEPNKNHGILFLENRSNKLKINVHNKNDIISIVGQPHYTSFDNEDIWIYFERILSKGKYHKLGKHNLKSNNTLVLYFDKYGVLNNKKFYNKEDLKKIRFSKKITEKQLTEKSFIASFLQSIKQKMYGSKKSD